MSHFKRRSFHDRSLVARVLEISATSSVASAKQIAEELQQLYPEYRRRKQNDFIAVIERIIAPGGNFPGSSKKKKKRKRDVSISEPSSPVNILDANDDSFSSDNDNYVSYPDSNFGNSTMKSLYRPPEPGADAHQGSPAFFLDKTPGTMNGKDAAVETKKSLSRILSGNMLNIEDTKKKRKTLARSQIDDIPVELLTLTFDDIGGCAEQLLESCNLVLHLLQPDIYTALGVSPPCGFLLHGPPGCGKSLFVNVLCGEFQIHLIKVAATELVSGVSGESEEKIRALFERATANSPCILFIDEIDAIAPKRDSAQREMEKRIVSQLISCLDDLSSRKDCRVLVIGATSRPDTLEPALRRAGRFDKEIALGIPDLAGRAFILKVVCKGLKLAEDVDSYELAKNTPGYVGADLSALAREACLCAVNRISQSLRSGDVLNVGSTENGAVSVHSPPGNTKNIEEELERVKKWLKDSGRLDGSQLDALAVTSYDFKAALKLVTPSAKREGFATVPDVQWSDIGALTDVREDLKWSILVPINYPEKFEAMGLSSKPQGVLLCGPPGCGKTLLAKAIANETGMNFISVKGPELLSMYVGESERAVRQVFQRARNSAPCVIFFDELDSLVPKRSEGDSGSSVRVVNQMLTEMDGMEPRKQVFLIGASNRPDIIDPAILRPGRLDKVVFVGFPTAADKVDILKAVTKNGQRPKFADDVDLNAIAQDPRGDHYSGADIAALVREASVVALKELMSNDCVMTNQRPDKMELNCNSVRNANLLTVPKVFRCHFETAFGNIKPSVTEKERARYEAVRLKYMSSHK